jgi:exosortase A-associated hydrolase 2
LCVWSLRGGNLVLADWLARESDRPPLLLWQPVSSGLQHLNQFLRLKSASEMLSSSGERAVGSKLRAELSMNRAVEVAGYRIAPALASGLSAATLRLPPQYPAPVAIFEVGTRENGQISPGIAALASEWASTGIAVKSALVLGPSFWQTLEIETAPELIAASSRVLRTFQ